MTAPAVQVGLIGLGRMGTPMARHLRAAGYAVIGYDLSEGARERAAAIDIRLADEVDEVAAGSDVVILMLPDSTVVEKVLLGGGLLDTMVTGSVIVDMGSSKPASTQRLAEQARSRGVGFVDAPVSGGVAGAEGGNLTVMVGGDPADVTRVRSILDTVGSTVTHLGPAGAGHALKALNNLMSAAHLLISSEALIAGERFGLDVQVMLDAVNASSGRSASTEVKWPKYIVPGTFDSGFSASLMLKDMKIAVELARECGITSRLGEAAVDLWAQADHDLPTGSDHTRIAAWLQRKS